MADGLVGLAAGATALGLLHGLAPGHGWAIAASYALDKPNKWGAGAAASLLLGLGHLVSSVAMVAAYFWALSSIGLTEVEWMHYVAGALLILLGVRQYRTGHAHDHGSEATAHDAHDHHDEGAESGHSHHDHGSHDHRHAERGVVGRLRSAIPVIGDGGHAHSHEAVDRDEDLLGMVGVAFALGFTHNEEFDIIAICTGSAYCLELMLLYSMAVLVSLVGVTLLLVAGFERYEDRLDRYAEYLPTVTAGILVAMGLGFLLGLF